MIGDNHRVPIWKKKRIIRHKLSTRLSSKPVRFRIWYDFLTKHLTVKFRSKSWKKISREGNFIAWKNYAATSGQIIKKKKKKNLKLQGRFKTIREIEEENEFTMKNKRRLLFERRERRVSKSMDRWGRSESKSTRSYSFPCGDNRWPPSRFPSLCCMPADTIRWFGQAERP